MSKSYNESGERNVPRRKERQRERRALNQTLGQISINTTAAEVEEMISQRVEKNPVRSRDVEQDEQNEQG